MHVFACLWVCERDSVTSKHGLGTEYRHNYDYIQCLCQQNCEISNINTVHSKGTILEKKAKICKVKPCLGYCELWCVLSVLCN